MSDAPALQFSAVCKRFDGREVLRGIDLTVARGEFFGLVGVNGAGKSTLLKCLLDFCLPDSGKIAIFGHDHRAPQARAPLAYLPERFNPPYYLRGRDFLQYMLQLQDLPWDAQAAAEMLHALDLAVDALEKPVRAYSKGMTQKLGLAAALLAKRDLYVLDEPMSGLDPRARAALKTRLQDLRQRKATLFFSSHALSDVEQLCDRMAILHGGKLCFVGAPAECIQQQQAANLEEAYLRCIAAA
ncbi:ABC transporter ATP-binding protein [Massilia sp. W12]|uniref:ABC transporter ATP-binding protein n=1 Tax=Massilia sp. W12 TaxID=3126507 RepID=UPI0030D397E1